MSSCPIPILLFPESLKSINIIIFSQSCGVDLGDKYVVIGGNGAERKVTQYKDTGFDRSLPELVIGRYDHACAKFRNGNGEEVSYIFWMFYVL